MFTAGSSQWTTGSSVKSVTLSQNASAMSDIPDLFFFFFQSS